MSILRTDKIAGLDSVSAITGSVFFGRNGTSAVASGNWLTAYSESDFSFGTGDFTIEYWFYFTGVSGSNSGCFQLSNTPGGLNNSNTAADGGLALNFENGCVKGIGNNGWFNGTNSVAVETWNHVALVRYSGTLQIFTNGVADTSASDSNNYSLTHLAIGGYYTNAYLFQGYISNFRICKGHAVYKGAFTPPTRQLTVHFNSPGDETVLLCCQSSQDPTQEATTSKNISIRKVNSNDADPLASTFTPDVGNDHTHGTVLEGGTAFSSLNYMTLPRGTTAQRANSRGRAVIPGGYNPTNSPVASRSLNTIEYIEINTTANAVDFGDLSYDSASGGTCSSSTRAVTGGGYVAPSITGSINTMSYFTIASTGNGTNFGDLSVARGYVASLSSDTRGIWAGGAGGPSSPYIQSDVSVTDYVTIASEGDATSFGELIDQGYMGDTACSSPTRGVIAGGNPATNVIQYVTIASTGVAKDFGDLIAASIAPGAASSHTRGIFCGSCPGAPAYTALNHIDYVTIASTGNAQDFGDSLFAGSYKAGTSNSIRAVWTGTYASPTTLNNIEYVQIQTLGNTVDFGDSTNSYGNRAGATSDTHGGLA